MSKAQLVITAVVLEGRSKSEVARDYELSRYWVQQLVTRYQTEGTAAFAPHSRRPHTNACAISPALEDKIVRLRKTLDKAGYDAGAATIAAHLARDPHVTKVPALSTIWRILARRGFVVPQPHKRPRSAWKRFTAAQPNELWQADVTHWHLADHTGAEILNILDDHSRLALTSIARPTMTGPDVMDSFLAAFTRWGTPAAVLTDNGAIFTATPRRGGRTALQILLGELGINYINSRPYHPQTCESPWKSWRLLTLETRMESCRRNSRQVSRRRVGIARRRRPLRCGWCAPCVPSWAPITGRCTGLPANSATASSRCGPGCARPTSTTVTRPGCRPRSRSGSGILSRRSEN
jgi:transposase